jgi:hypothetical protein
LVTKAAISGSTHLCFLVAARFAVIAPQGRRGAFERGLPPLWPPLSVLRAADNERAAFETFDFLGIENPHGNIDAGAGFP